MYKVLAVNDDKDSCECCGKQGLKRVVWIENIETGDIQHFGTTCAANPAKAFGLDSEIKKAVRQFVSQQEQQAKDLESKRVIEACKLAIKTYKGEMKTVVISFGPRKGLTFETAVDEDDYESHKLETIKNYKVKETNEHYFSKDWKDEMIQDQGLTG